VADGKPPFFIPLFMGAVDLPSHIPVAVATLEIVKWLRRLAFLTFQHNMIAGTPQD
jgi:hypothetical protein